MKAFELGGEFELDSLECVLTERSHRVHNVLMMNVIALRRLRKFWTDHADAESPLRRWYGLVCKAEWKNFLDIRSVFRSADVWTSSDSGKSYIIFNIGGNNYRLIASIWYEGNSVYIKRIMTHAEYDEENWKDGL